MIKFIQYFKFYFIWLTLFIIYYSLLYKFELLINYPIMYSAYLAVWISTLIDIVKKEPEKSKFYKFDTDTNQKIRYIVFLLATVFIIVGHIGLLCNTLKIFRC